MLNKKIVALNDESEDELGWGDLSESENDTSDVEPDQQSDKIQPNPVTTNNYQETGNVLSQLVRAFLSGPTSIIERLKTILHRETIDQSTIEQEPLLSGKLCALINIASDLVAQIPSKNPSSSFQPSLFSNPLSHTAPKPASAKATPEETIITDFCDLLAEIEKEVDSVEIHKTVSQAAAVLNTPPADQKLDIDALLAQINIKKQTE